MLFNKSIYFSLFDWIFNESTNNKPLSQKMIEYEQQLGIQLEITENLTKLMSNSNKIVL